MLIESYKNRIYLMLYVMISQAIITLTHAQNLDRVFFERSQYTVDENAQSVQVALKRSGNLHQPLFVAVEVLEEPDPQSVDDISALAGRDFKAGLIPVQFKANEDKVIVPIDIIDNTTIDGNKTFRLEISNPSHDSGGLAPYTNIKVRDNEHPSFLDLSYRYSSASNAILSVQPNGQILARQGTRLVRLNPDGEVDLSFVADFVSDIGVETFRFVERASVSNDGKVYAGGMQERFNPNAPDQFNVRTWIERYDSNGRKDESFNFNSGSRIQWLTAMTTLPSGELMLAGNSENFNTGSSILYLMKVLENGSVDPDFPATPVFRRDDGARISTIKPLDDGSIAVAGSFGQHLVDQVGQGLLFFHEDGRLHETFQSSLASPSHIEDFQILDDGTILLCGQIHDAEGPVFQIVRMLANGDLDPSFNPTGLGFNGSVHSLEWDSSLNAVYVSGNFTQYGEKFAPYLARLDLSSNTLENTLRLHRYVPGIHGRSHLNLLPDSTLFVEQNKFDFSDLHKNVIEFAQTQVELIEGDPVQSITIRRTGDSHAMLTVDLEIRGNGAVKGVDYEIVPERIIFQPFKTEVSVDIHPMDDGEVDGSKVLSLLLKKPSPTVDIGFNDTVQITIEDNEHPYSVDLSYQLESNYDSHSVVKFVGDGFVIGSRNRLIGTQEDGRIRFDSSQGNSDMDSWTILDVFVQSDGMILVSGIDNDPSPRPFLVRFNPESGERDDAFADPTFLVSRRYGAEILSLEEQSHSSGNKILAGGRFDGVGSLRQQALIRLNMDGSLDPSFDTGQGFSNSISPYPAQIDALEVLPGDQGIMVGGKFDTFDGKRVNNIALLKSDGSLDTGFQPQIGFVRNITSILGVADGSVLVAATFDDIQVNLIKFNLDGSRDESFLPVKTTGNIEFITQVNDGRFLVTGNFHRIQGVPKSWMAQLHSDGSLDMSFLPGNQITGAVRQLFPSEDGRLWVSGVLSRFDGASVGNIFPLRPIETMSEPLIVFSKQAESYRLKEGGALIDDSYDWFDDIPADSGLNDRVTVEVTRLGATDKKVSFDVLVDEFGATEALDFGTESTDLSFEALSNTANFEIQVIDDGLVEPFEWADLAIQHPSQNMISRARIEIVDDEIPLWTDPAYQSEMPSNTRVTDFVVLNDGSTIAASANHPSKLWKLTGSGQIDDSFQFQLDESVSMGVDSLLLLPDGSLLVGGHVTINGRTHLPVLKKINAITGNLDDAFQEPEFSRSREGESITALAIQEIHDDIRILIGGDFRLVNGNSISRLARLHLDGTYDTSFELSEGIDSEMQQGVVRSIVVLPDDHGLLVGGSFSEVDGHEVSNLVKLSSQGKIEGAVSNEWGFLEQFWEMHVSSLSGNVLIAGQFSALDTQLVRWHPEGGLDRGFQEVHLNQAVTSLIEDAEEQVYLSGSFNEINGVPSSGFGRLRADGSLDLDYHAGRTMGGTIFDLNVDPEGRLLLGGSMHRFDEISVSSMVRLNATTDLLESTVVFSGNQSRESLSEAQLNSIELDLLRLGDRQFESQVLVSAIEDTGVLGEDYQLLNPVVSFEPLQAESTATIQAFDDGCVETLETGRIQLMPGRFSSQSQFSFQIEDNEEPLLRDYSYAPGVNFPNIPELLSSLPDGQLLIGGSVQFGSQQERRVVVILNADGSVHEAFDVSPHIEGWAVTAALINGDIVIGGEFPVNDPAGNRHARIIRLTHDGQIVPGYATGSGPDGTVYSLASDSKGRVLVGGGFNRYDGELRRFIVRLDDVGGIDRSWNPDIPNDYVRRIYIQHDGNYIITGGFTRVNRVPRNGLARLNAEDGTLDLEFDPQIEGYIADVLPLKNGSILLAGDFSRVDGFPRNDIVRLMPDGSVDPTFSPDIGFNWITSVKEDDQGMLIVAGHLTAYLGDTTAKMIRLFPDGTVDGSFERDLGKRSDIQDFTFALDGMPILFGQFPNFEGSEETLLFKLSAHDPSQTMVNFSETFYQAFEPEAQVNLLLERVGDVSQASEVVVHLNETDQVEDKDFFATEIIGRFEPLEDEIMLTIPIHDDLQPEPDEWSSVQLSARTANVKVGIHEAAIRLADNDRPGSLDESFQVNVYRYGRNVWDWLGAPSFVRRPPAGWRQGTILEMQIQKDGQLLIHGDFELVNETMKSGMARLYPDGKVDEAFELSPQVSNVERIQTQSDGSIVIIGSTHDGGRLFRVDPQGRFDHEFHIIYQENDLFSDDLAIRGMEVLEDDRILIWGRFSHTEHTGLKHIARLHPDGTLDTSFDVHGGPNHELYRWSTARLPNGAIVVGGDFTKFANQDVPYLVKLNPTGSIDESFDLRLHPDLPVEGIRSFQNGALLIQGGFSKVQNQNSNDDFLLVLPGGERIVSYHLPGLRLPNVAMQSDNRLLISSGDYVSNTMEPYPQRIFIDGSLDTTFDVGLGYTGRVNAQLLSQDGDHFLVGSFSDYNGVPVQASVLKIRGSGVFAILGIDFKVDGTASVIARSFPGEIISLEVSEDLTHWVEIDRQIASSNTVELTDEDAGEVRFYRVIRH